MELARQHEAHKQGKSAAAAANEYFDEAKNAFSQSLSDRYNPKVRKDPSRMAPIDAKIFHAQKLGDEQSKLANIKRSRHYSGAEQRQKHYDAQVGKTSAAATSCSDSDVEEVTNVKAASSSPYKRAKASSR